MLVTRVLMWGWRQALSFAIGESVAVVDVPVTPAPAIE